MPAGRSWDVRNWLTTFSAASFRRLTEALTPMCAISGGSWGRLLTARNASRAFVVPVGITAEISSFMIRRDEQRWLVDVSSLLPGEALSSADVLERSGKTAL